MSYHGKRERPEDGGNYGPPQKRPSGGYGLPQPCSFGGPGRQPYDGFPSQYSQPPSSQQRLGSYAPPLVNDDISSTRFCEEKRGNILLITILNPKYPITVEVMHTICTNSNAVVHRIVILRKNGVQALVEFDSVQAAENIKETLNGADIYSGCCTLKIEWAKASRLNVTKNDQDTWDYTSPKLGQDNKVHPLLPDPKFGSGERSNPNERFVEFPEDSKQGPLSQGGYQDHHRGQQRHDDYQRNPAGDRHGMVPPRGPPAPRQEYHPPAYEHHGNHYSRDNFRGGRGGHYPRGGVMRGGMRPMYPPHMMVGQARMDDYPDYDESGPMLQQGSVMMVYGLDGEKMNCKKLFNLFCLYGNVVRIKFLKSKEGVAMVQMGDCMSCERAANALNGTYIFGKKTLIGNSKQAFIQDVPNPTELPDGSPSFQDFMGNRNNRFTTPEAANKNRIHSSSKMLYFFNAPPGLKDEDLLKVFNEGHVKEPKRIKVFPTKSAEKSSTGLIEWDNKNDSVDALVVCNHTPLPNPSGKNPYILKFCFSDVTIKNSQPALIPDKSDN